MAIMTPLRQAAEIAALREVLAQFPNGASLEQVSVAAALPVSERTLIRRLAQMVEDGIARKEGASRAARYVLNARMEFREDPPAPLQREMRVPVGAVGGEIQRLVTRPIHARRPVGYHRAFLAGYQPNRSSYLTAAEKAQLAAISKTVDAADPRAGTYAQRILNRLLIDLSWNSSRLE